ncbi:MAG TPA: tetratricopeptide repeat protein [Pirellulales bacterium]|jgi:tetratricopeptide (TPR) repeat protein|nr:tetratricopeptide repeat protein [Pirellulales bacterium]
MRRRAFVGATAALLAFGHGGAAAWAQFHHHGGGFGELADGESKHAERPKIRVSNAESVARARRFIAFGDGRFHTQEFSDAYQRYKKAAAAAPDLAEAHFRQGFSLLAMGRYASAAKAIKHGLTLEPDWAASNFRSDDLYGNNRLAKVAHLERLASAATEHPRSADLMFLLGIALYCDRQPERSRLFFQRAGELGAERAAIAGFLKVEPPPVAGDSVRGREL